LARPPRLKVIDPGRSSTWARRGRLRIDCVGESRYQDVLGEIAGGKRAESQYIETNAEIRREPGNLYDANAIQVLVGGQLVAYLPKEEAALYAPVMDARGLRAAPCPAEIRGGWRDETDEGSFGVVVWLPAPGTL
jgi:HIRAN domain